MFDRGSARPGYHDVIVGDDLGDDHWHQIDIERFMNHVVIKLDITRKYITTENGHKPLNIDLDVSVGGFQPHTTKGPSDPLLPQPSLTGTVFKGCMEDVTYNEINILQAVEEESRHVRVTGKVQSKCNEDHEYFPPATLKTPTSFIQLNITEEQSVNLQFKFRTFDHTGILVHQIFRSAGNGCLLLELVDGKLDLKLTSKRPRILVNLSPKTPTLANGLWHTIQLNFSSEEIAIQVNNEIVQELLNVSRDAGCLFKKVITKIGSSLPGKTALIGCVKEIHLNGAKNVMINSAMTKDVDIDKCYLIDRCFANPCKNNGHCLQHNNTAQCNCSGTGHQGMHCEKSSDDLGTNLRETTSRIRSIYARTSSSKSLRTKPTKSIDRFVTTRIFQDSLSSLRLPSLQATEVLAKLPSTVSKTFPVIFENTSKIVNFVPTMTYTSEHVISSRPSEVTINARNTALHGYIAHSIMINNVFSKTRGVNNNFQPTTSVPVSQTIALPVTSTMTAHRPPSARVMIPATVQSTRTNDQRTIIIEKRNKVTTVGLSQKQLFIYIFFCVAVILTVGFIVIISFKISRFTTCERLKRFGLSSTESLSGQDPTESNERDVKEGMNEKKKRRARLRLPSSLNDSGIDRSDCGTTSNRSSAEMNDEMAGKESKVRIDCEVFNDARENFEKEFLIFQEDPSLYTQDTQFL